MSEKLVIYADENSLGFPADPRDGFSLVMGASFPWFGKWHFVAVMGTKLSRLFIEAELRGYDIDIVESFGTITLKVTKALATKERPYYYDHPEATRIT